jgi:GNAT superfamily N-acetyltransferase
MSEPNRRVETRKARIADAAALAELCGQLGYPATVTDIQERLIRLLHRPRYSVVLVAELAPNKVIGWLHVSVTPLLEVPLRAEVNGLVVAEGQRSAGAGAKLLQAAERWAKGQACKSMSVRSNIIRDRAHAFYLRHGYEHYKTQKAFRKNL